MYFLPANTIMAVVKCHSEIQFHGKSLLGDMLALSDINELCAASRVGGDSTLRIADICNYSTYIWHISHCESVLINVRRLKMVLPCIVDVM